MDASFRFLNLEGLDDTQVKQIKDILHPSNLSPEIEFPWNSSNGEGCGITKGNSSSLNVHAPAFEAYVSVNNHQFGVVDPHYSPANSYNNDSNQTLNNSPLISLTQNYSSSLDGRTVQHGSSNFSNDLQAQQTFPPYNHCLNYCEAPKTLNGDIYPIAHPTQVHTSTTTFKLNPTVSCFVPQNIQGFVQNQQTISNGYQLPVMDPNLNLQNNTDHESETYNKQSGSDEDTSISQVVQNGVEQKYEQDSDATKEQVKTDNIEILSTPKSEGSSSVPTRRSWADVVSSGQRSNEKVQPSKPIQENGTKVHKVPVKLEEADSLSVDEDKMSLILGKYLYQLPLDFQPVFLQPRGLINRRNWCYINATLQALLACPPFYTLLRNLPLGPGVDRGKSSTPVIDSMVKVAYEFLQYQSSQEELQLGQPFQPDFIYDMLRDLKSDCLKGQQEDAEEFLSFILNGMHEEMVKIIKNYEKKNHLNLDNDMKENGDVSEGEGEDDWQVIGSKHKGMVTRKVAEHKTPISDLLGGQIKSFLTTSGNKTSASIQPFFTLQLDIQSENVTSVSEALKEMTVKEPIQGYTCAKTKQEVEAYSHIALQKLPPILILHLKRFVYNKNGGCKKVMKKTDYPIELELNKDLFSPDVKKNQRLRLYKLFAVMYHDGEEAVKGHYISDVYNHGSQSWVRCDDRAVSVVTETQVLSHSPPRVPYLLFYQES